MVKRIRYKGQIYEAVNSDTDYKVNRILRSVKDCNGVNRIKRLGWDYISNAYGNMDYYVVYGNKGKLELLIGLLEKNKLLIHTDPYDGGSANDAWKEYISPYSNIPIDKLAREIISNDDETRFISDANERIDLGNNFFAYRAN